MDVFEDQRQYVRGLQARLKAEGERCTEVTSELLDRASRYEVSLETVSAARREMRTKLNNLEFEVMKEMAKLPPHAEERDGVIWLLPVHRGIDPWATV